MNNFLWYLVCGGLLGFVVAAVASTLWNGYKLFGKEKIKDE